MTWKELREAVAADGVNYITGLIAPAVMILGYSFALPLPLSTVVWVRRALKNTRSRTYVDWNLPTWPDIYHRELSNVLRFHLNNRQYCLPQVLVHENRSGLPLAQYGLGFELDKRPFVISPELAARTEKIFPKVLMRNARNPYFSDQENVRLVSHKEKSNKLILKVQPAWYTDYLRTNLLLDYSGDHHESLRSLIHSNGSLEQLSESRLANLLGVNVLLLTADGGLIVVKRSKDVTFRSGELAPSSSGTITRADAEKSGSTFIIPRTILRETTEEIGNHATAVPQNDLTYLGITRELIRGGQPELFFVMRTDHSESEIKRLANLAEDRWENSRIRMIHVGKLAFENLDTPDQIHEFKCSIDECYRKIWPKASLTLLTALALWVRFKTKSYT
ncbi:MAG: hypothetical protein KGJ49_10575 [Alphaproteobacteria bacterium]|nr:hypothetical protein [Alphaproteobacteria bacterium]